MNNEIVNCPRCGAVAIKVTLKDELIGEVAKIIVNMNRGPVLIDPAPTAVNGHLARHLFKKVYRCPNCGHEWTK